MPLRWQACSQRKSLGGEGGMAWQKLPKRWLCG